MKPLTEAELATMREAAQLDNFDDLGGWRPDLQLRLLATFDVEREVLDRIERAFDRTLLQHDVAYEDFAEVALGGFYDRRQARR